MPARDERPVRRARRVAWAWRGRAPSTHGTLYSPTSPQQAPADIGRSHALEDGLGALPELTGRRTDPSPPARAPALALSRAQRPAGGTPGPAAHCSGCPICPQPTCPSPSRAHLTGCRLAAGGPDRRRGSETPLAGLGGPGSLCGASLLVPLGCLPRQQRFSCLFQPFLCRLQPFQRRPAGLGDGLGRPRVADVEWVGLGGSGRCCLGREASAISVDRWGKPQNWPRQSPGTRRGIAPLPARRMARFDRLTRFFGAILGRYYSAGKTEAVGHAPQNGPRQGFAIDS